ncbi:MAG: hypothetical protein MZV64_63495 [Ignavibacteriales bacterium]|nr:hypothetical protein [Ignavibacteriales bacterium]
MTPAGFHQRVTSAVGATVAYDEFFAMYNDIFTPNAPVARRPGPGQGRGLPDPAPLQHRPGALRLRPAPLPRDRALRRLRPVLRAQAPEARPGHLPGRGRTGRAVEPARVRLHRRHGGERRGRRRRGLRRDPLPAGDGPRRGAPQARPPLLNRGHDTYFRFS